MYLDLFLELFEENIFWEGYIWEIIDEEDIYCSRLAQFGTTFVFSKKQNGGAGKKNRFFKILALIFIFFKNRLQHNSAQT